MTDARYCGAHTAAVVGFISGGPSIRESRIIGGLGQIYGTQWKEREREREGEV